MLRNFRISLQIVLELSAKLKRMKSHILKAIGLVMVALAALTACRNEDNRIPETCFDEIRNQGELRVDCGGPNCPPCPATCDDRLSNQGEASVVPFAIGIDCGGPNCPPCSTCEDGIQNSHWVFDPNLKASDLNKPNVGQDLNGKLYRLVMERGIDCGFPCPNFCEPTCEDGIMNGDEQGVDCGGSNCSFPCPPPTCFDGIQNGDETGIDCGSSQCFLLGLICPDPTCSDGIQNVHIEVNPLLPGGYVVVVEAGIDCDLNPLTSCPDCPIPTCFDGVRNQGETGIDCGGPCPTACNPVPNCNDGVQNGDETGIDCGGPDCPPCPTCGDGFKNGPELDVDCVDYPIPFYPCPQCISCHDGLQNEELSELDVDCGGPNCPKCKQFLVVNRIGPGNGLAFRDQWSMNALLALANPNNPDTLAVPNALTIGNTQGFNPQYRTIRAVQQINTTNGIFQRVVELSIPRPNSFGLIPFDNNPVTINMVPYEPLIQPPTIRYTEGFITGPFAGTATYQATSNLAGDPAAQLRITYNFFNLQGGYIKGEVSWTRLDRFPPNPLNPDETGRVEMLQFQIQYNPFQ